MKSIVSSKGQITLPVELREKLGLAAGTAVQFELREGGALIRKGSSDVHPVDRVFGRLKLPTSVDRIMDAMRGPRPGADARRGRRRASKR
ncbi:MAG: AbrB/MazE/SpoVT family DNA-binding domain-containing protein [Candidatus Rokubacteria bacterium]|nr:AbrB/MazE/SpoVT family DNA-binding domain-containing protein [Candidatus Rokubacteria bacterium]